MIYAALTIMGLSIAVMMIGVHCFRRASRLSRLGALLATVALVVCYMAFLRDSVAQIWLIGCGDKDILKVRALPKRSDDKDC